MRQTRQIVTLNPEYTKKPLRARRAVSTVLLYSAPVDNLADVKPEPFTFDANRLKYALEHAHRHDGEPVHLYQEPIRPAGPPTLHELKVRVSERFNLWVHALKRSHAQPHG